MNNETKRMNVVKTKVLKAYGYEDCIMDVDIQLENQFAVMGQFIWYDGEINYFIVYKTKRGWIK